MIAIEAIDYFHSMLSVVDNTNDDSYGCYYPTF